MTRIFRVCYDYVDDSGPEVARPYIAPKYVLADGLVEAAKLSENSAPEGCRVQSVQDEGEVIE